MKQPKRLTRAQKIFHNPKNQNPENWALVEENKDALIIYNKNSKKVREIKF